MGDSRKTLDDRFHIIKHKLSSKKKKKHEIKRVRDRLNELIKQDRIPKNFLFPYGFRVGKLLPDECRPLSAATKPLLLVFEALADDKTANPIGGSDPWIELVRPKVFSSDLITVLRPHCHRQVQYWSYVSNRMREMQIKWNKIKDNQRRAPTSLNSRNS